MSVQCLVGLQPAKVVFSSQVCSSICAKQLWRPCTCKARPWRNEMRRHVHTFRWNGRAGTKGPGKTMCAKSETRMVRHQIPYDSIIRNSPWCGLPLHATSNAICLTVDHIISYNIGHAGDPNANFFLWRCSPPLALRCANVLREFVQAMAFAWTTASSVWEDGVLWVVVKSSQKIGAARTPGHQQELWCESEPTVPTVPTVPAISAVPAARLVQSDDVRCIFCFCCLRWRPTEFAAVLRSIVQGNYKTAGFGFWVTCCCFRYWYVMVCNGM